jgi:hypothetical protein
MHFGSSLALWILASLCVPALAADSPFLAEFRTVCPGSKPTTGTFDKRPIAFDSVVDGDRDDKIPAKSIVYCLQIQGAPHEYVVEWSEHGMKNLATTSRGYYGFRISHITRDLKSGPSTVYVGVNNTVYKPNIFKEQGAIETLVNRILGTIFVGSMPKNPDKTDVERYQNLFPVALSFRARHKDGVAVLEYVNTEPSQKREIEFEFGEEITKRIPELSGRFIVGPAPKSTSYKVPWPAPARTVITFRNPDHQPVANMPIVMFLPK